MRTISVLREHVNWSLELTPEQEHAISAYSEKLVSQLIAVVGSALADLAPARLSFGRSEPEFAVNRRARTDDGYRLGVNPDGPVDHQVHVLRVCGFDSNEEANRMLARDYRAPYVVPAKV